MTGTAERQEFRIYPAIKDVLANDHQGSPLFGSISLEDRVLIAEDGTRYHLNLAKYAINDTCVDGDNNGSVDGMWFIPLDEEKWCMGDVSGGAYYGFEQDGRWLVYVSDNTVQPTKHFNPLEGVSFKRCIRVVRIDGDEQVMSCFVEEKPKLIIQYCEGVNLPLAKMTRPQDHLATAFVNDENGNVVGYIYPK